MQMSLSIPFTHIQNNIEHHVCSQFLDAKMNVQLLVEFIFSNKMKMWWSNKTSIKNIESRPKYNSVVIVGVEIKTNQIVGCTSILMSQS